MGENKVFYFGPIRRAGHYFWLNDSTTQHRLKGIGPWGTKVDGSLAPALTDQKEGEALVHHKEGWTAISFWDRTVDKRPGCSSTYLIEGTFTFEEMAVLAKEAFPERWGAMGFEVIELPQEKS